jgi:hypothetical protein
MATQDPWTEGRDGSKSTYRERLHPPVVVVLLMVAFAGLVGVAYGAAYGPPLGWAAGIALGALGLGLLAATSTRVRVDDCVLRAGRARLPLTAIGDAEPLDASAMRDARRHGDPRDYLVLRAWSSRRGVAVAVADPRDPHPRWLISSRHPEQLAQAIRAACHHRGCT